MKNFPVFMLNFLTNKWIFNYPKDTHFTRFFPCFQTMFRSYDSGITQGVVEDEFKSIQKQPLEVLCKKGVLRNFAKSTEKHLCQRLFFNKVASLRQLFLRTPFLQKTSGRLLLSIHSRLSMETKKKVFSRAGDTRIFSVEKENTKTRKYKRNGWDEQNFLYAFSLCFFSRHFVFDSLDWNLIYSSKIKTNSLKLHLKQNHRFCSEEGT